MTLINTVNSNGKRHLEMRHNSKKQWHEKIKKSCIPPETKDGLSEEEEKPNTHSPINKEKNQLKKKEYMR